MVMMISTVINKAIKGELRSLLLTMRMVSVVMIMVSADSIFYQI